MRNITTILFLLFTLGWTNAQTTVFGTIQSGGLTRDYRLYVPAAYTGAVRVPLVLNLHGYTSNSFEQEFYSFFYGIADTANFLMVCPNGTLDNQGNRFWNAFGGTETVDDVSFLSSLIDSLSATYQIDTNRIYCTGMSNGGFMSYLLACELNDRIAAIASVTGSMVTSEFNACNPQRPVPVLEIHGTADNTVPYNGFPLYGFKPVPEVVAAWVGFNHCNPTPVFNQIPDIDTSDGCTAEHYLYTGGENGSTVEHFKIIGGGHTWPGSPINIGVTNQDINASKEIWRFFSQYRLDVLTDLTEPEVLQASQWSAYPNPFKDQLTVASNSQKPVRRIRVFDALGRLRQSIPANEPPFRIETVQWEPGVYFILVEQSEKTERIVVVKN